MDWWISGIACLPRENASRFSNSNFFSLFLSRFRDYCIWTLNNAEKRFTKKINLKQVFSTNVAFSHIPCYFIFFDKEQSSYCFSHTIFCDNTGLPVITVILRSLTWSTQEAFLHIKYSKVLMLLFCVLSVPNCKLFSRVHSCTALILIFFDLTAAKPTSFTLNKKVFFTHKSTTIE